MVFRKQDHEAGNADGRVVENALRLAGQEARRQDFDVCRAAEIRQRAAALMERKPAPWTLAALRPAGAWAGVLVAVVAGILLHQSLTGPGDSGRLSVEIVDIEQRIERQSYRVARSIRDFRSSYLGGGRPAYAESRRGELRYRIRSLARGVESELASAGLPGDGGRMF